MEPNLRLSSIIISLCLYSASGIDYVNGDNPVPIVLWHGMGDSCCNPLSLGSIMKFLDENIPGVYIKSLQFGNNAIEDMENSYFMNVNEQVDLACNQIKSDKALKNGYNSIGFSQGGQFLRALAQRCPSPNMKNLISVGGQHQGVYGLPRCMGQSHEICDMIRKLLNTAAYTDFMQSHLVQAQYWHDPLNEEEYKKKSTFIAVINNELVRNETYKNNLMQLDNLVMIMFEDDTMVQPRESEWFGFYVPGQAVKTFAVQNSSLYTEDRLGLKQMDSQGKLHFLSLPGQHLQIDMTWFLQNIVKKFLM